MHNRYTSLSTEMTKVVRRFRPDTPNCELVTFAGGDENPTGEVTGAVESATPFAAVVSSAAQKLELEPGGALEEGELRIRYVVGPEENDLPAQLNADDTVDVLGERYEVKDGGALQWNGESGPFWAKLREVQHSGGI